MPDFSKSLRKGRWGAPELIPLPESLDERMHGVYWRPRPEFVAELSSYLSGKKVLEIFAGNGLLAGLLAREGVSVQATSILSSMDAHENGIYHPVENLPAGQAVFDYGDDNDVLLVVWPTVTPEVLAAVRLWGHGKEVVFIGEITDYSRGLLGGCATDEFFDSMDIMHEFETYKGNCIERAVVMRLNEIL